jgi:hypothetical protein
MKRLALACLFLLVPTLLSGQVQRTLTATGTLSVVDAGTCTTTTTGCVILRSGGARNISVQLTGTCGTCTVLFEMSVDGTTWVAQLLTPPGTAVAVSTTSAVGVWTGPVGPGAFRARLSAWASGSFVVTARAVP